MAAQAVGDALLAARFLVLGLQAHAAIALGDWSGAASAAEEGRRLSDETRQPSWAAAALVAEAVLAAAQGRVDESEARIGQAERAVAGAGSGNLRALVQLARGVGLLATGRHAEAYDALARMFDTADPAFCEREMPGAVGYLAEAAVHAGRVEGARAVIDALEPSPP